MAKHPSLNDLSEAAKKCISCGLCDHRTNVVPGEGDEHAQVMFIGEAPGYHEDKQARPFVGPAGKLLNELLDSIGLERGSVYITNVVKCRPPGNRDPQPAEIEACMPWLEEQIELINPRIIVTLGRHSLAHFVPRETISRIHGKPRTVGGRTILPMYHPAAALYQQTLRKTLEEDFSKIPELLKQPPKDQDPPARPAREEKPPDDNPGPQQLSLF